MSKITVEPFKLVFELHMLAKDDKGQVVAEPVVNGKEGPQGPEKLIVYAHQLRDLPKAVVALVAEVEAGMNAADEPTPEPAPNRAQRRSSAKRSPKR